MGWLRGLLGIATGGISGFFTNDKNKKPKEPTIADQLAPFLQQYTNIANRYSDQANTDFGKATSGYDEAINFYRNLFKGKQEDLLSMLDSTEITAGLDEQQKQNYELAPRGGRRAATAANLGFDKFGQLNSFLQNLRQQAPGQIANIAQAYGNLGTGKLNAAMGGIGGASNLLFGMEQIKQQEKDRRSELLSGIFSAIGSTIGFLACNTLDTLILTPNGYKPLYEIQIGEKVLTPIGLTGEFEESKVIRKEVVNDEDIYEIKVNGSHLKGTLSHELVTDKEEEKALMLIGNEVGSLLLCIGNKISIQSISSFRKTNIRQKVAILKLNDEKKNYRYITNGFISVDADCK